MPRPRRQKPYNPAKVHDRQAKDYSKGLANYLDVVEVDDPFEPGAKITATRSTRDDPLGDHHKRGVVSEAQYQAGRAFQQDFERAERGPKAIDLKEFVDGGLMPEPLTDAQRKAGRSLARVYRALGANGSALAHDVLIHCRTMKQVAMSRGLVGKAWEEYYGKRFREALDTMAVLYGFSNACG